MTSRDKQPQPGDVIYVSLKGDHEAVQGRYVEPAMQGFIGLDEGGEVRWINIDTVRFITVISRKPA